MLPKLPSYLRGASEGYKQRLAEEAVIINADTSHLDNKRVSIYVQHIKRGMDKAYLCLIGYWRGTSQREALIPVWLAKRIGIPITIRTTVFD